MKETYLKQMDVLKGVVVEARRFNLAHALEKSDKKTRSFDHLLSFGEKLHAMEVNTLKQTRNKLQAMKATTSKNVRSATNLARNRSGKKLASSLSKHEGVAAASLLSPPAVVPSHEGASRSPDVAAPLHLAP